MSINFERGLFVRILELERGPHPKPLGNGFVADAEYRVLGIYNPSESGECWLIMANDRDEIWYISQRHVRVCSLRPADMRFRVDGISKPCDAASSTVTPPSGIAGSDASRSGLLALV